MSNKVDSIQKLSREELEKSRKLILESIGESEVLNKPEETEVKKVDSLRPAEEKSISENKLKPKQVQHWQEEIKKVLPRPTPPEAREKSTFAPDFIKQTPLDDIRKPLPSPLSPPAKDMRLKATELQAQTKKREIAAKQAQVAKRAAAQASQEQTRQVAEKRKAELRVQAKRKQILLKEAEKRKKTGEKKKSQEKKRKTRRDHWANIKKAIASLSSHVRLGARKSLFLFIAVFIFIVLAYSVYIVVILKLNYDNNTTRKINEILPVPVLISAHGFMDYYQYQDLVKNIRDQYSDKRQVDHAIKINFSKNIIITELIKKYRLKNEDFSLDDLADKIIYDTEVNQVAINRIQKIKEMIESSSDFVKIADKYGDEQGRLTILIVDQDKYSYINKVKDLSIGEVSDIVFTPDGYYIFRCYNKTEAALELSYALIKPIALEEYLEQVIYNLQIWSFVD